MPRILMVEDDEMNRDMLALRLQRCGYEVLLAIDGLDGIAVARRETPDLILMDVSLPLLDGWQATRRIRQAPETVAIPVIALTAHSMASDRAMAREAGCNDYETKPVDLKRLVEKIAALLIRPVRR
jgi:two-component system cell cycle response regulator DivK